jgi:RNA polymerase sigma factor (sigma-70 family)
MDVQERNELVLQWQPLVWKIALYLWNRYPSVRRIGSIEDLAGAGQLGLLDAIRLWDPQHPSKATRMTFFHRSITIRMLRDALADNLIAVPEYLRRQIRKPQATEHPFVEAARKALKIRHLADYFDKHCLPDEANEDRRIEGLHTAMRWLNRNERQLLAERFGLDGEAPSTFQEMADRRQRSRERMRQCLSRIYSKLRQHFPVEK